MFKRIAGTKDILQGEVSWWQRIEAISRNIFSLYNYQEIRLPLIEEALLFHRSLGESTQIVQKQMFLISPVRDYRKIQKKSMSLNGVRKEKDIYALRPEGTASVVRAYIENNLEKKAGFVKLYYIGPMFRCERPQKGRLRQFHHLGCEAIGSLDADLDIEIISLADTLLRSFSISGYKIKINSLGCPKDQKALTQILREDLKASLSKLCAECKMRFKNNPLRILDCKKESCLKEIKKLAIQYTYLCDGCRAHFSQMKEGLNALKINYEITPHLVRGLDYYTGTVFEITHHDLGSQDALGAGGRYNHLVRQLGGADAGAIGFALGMERLFLVSRINCKISSQNLVYIVALGEKARKQSLKLLDNLRKSNVAADTDYQNKSLKGALRRANDLGARYVLILGENELKNNVVTLKDMASGEQKEVIKEDLIIQLRNRLK